jgi:hypothetical protein
VNNFSQAVAQSLPVKSREIDAALFNGIFNLNPAHVRLVYAVATFRPRRFHALHHKTKVFLPTG